MADHSRRNTTFLLISAAAMLLCFGSVSAVALAAPVQQPLEIHIALSHTTALLGEPVWVEVTATNHTKEPIAVSWGAACPVFGTHPIEIHVPDATQGSGKATPCGHLGGNCIIPWPATLAPGESEGRRYVLEGDFRIVQPGRYRVVVHKAFPWSPASEKLTVALRSDHSTQMADFEGTLEVVQPDPARLLAIEKSLAAEAAKPFADTPLSITSGLSQEANLATVRTWSKARSKAEGVSSQHRYELYEALAAYPAAGMESTFVTWETYPRQTGYGIKALEKLNTPEARKALAHLAEPLPERIFNGVRQTNSRWVAVRALASTGDLTYLSLIEAYASDPDPDVRRAAIFGMGELGGEQALPTLDLIARQTTNKVERTDAISTMGRTKSAKAVPLLIAIFDIQNAEDPGAPNYALMTLTHHAVLSGIHIPARMKSEWATWWKVNSKTAQIFGPNDCTETYTH